MFISGLDRTKLHPYSSSNTVTLPPPVGKAGVGVEWSSPPKLHLCPISNLIVRSDPHP